jgi:hypothetical protein
VVNRGWGGAAPAELWRVAQLAMMDACEGKRHEVERIFMENVIDAKRARGNLRFDKFLISRSELAGEICFLGLSALELDFLQNESKGGCGGTNRRPWCGLMGLNPVRFARISDRIYCSLDELGRPEVGDDPVGSTRQRLERGMGPGLRGGLGRCCHFWAASWAVFAHACGRLAVGRLGLARLDSFFSFPFLFSVF